MTQEPEVKEAPCPQCQVPGNTLRSYGVHPVYPASRENASLDMQVEVQVCTNCGHVELRQMS